MSRVRGALVLAILAAASVVQAEEPAIDGRKQARAVRLASGSIRLDGRLDDEAWLNASPITEFIQAEPVEGAPPSDPMEVRFLFDDAALWVGARMRSAPGTVIQAPMSRRDDGEQAEYLQIELDTYLDRRTAYMFGVTASGVRLDHYHPTDDEDDTDSQFDPVWEARTSVDDGGWTAELWLPFSQLRFNDQPERVWGLNVKRWRPQLNEENYWVIVGRTERGLGVAVRRAARHRRRAAGEAARGDALRRRLVDDDRQSRSRAIRSTTARTWAGGSAPTSRSASDRI